MNAYETGQHDNRPWGSWRVVDVGERYVVKRIAVSPGARLSLQYHHGRVEHWVIVQGRARVTLDDQVLDRATGESVHIPSRAVHRIENPGDVELIFVEVQTGERLDESDIVRLSDTYGRV